MQRNGGNGTLKRSKDCLFSPCHRRPTRTGYCRTHQRQINSGKKPREVKYAPRGSGSIDAYGYRVVTTGGRKIKEHRVVMSQILGRPLRDYENVHHKNGVRTDNRPENLELWISKQPKGQRPRDLLEWAYEIIDLYGGEEDRFGD